MANILMVGGAGTGADANVDNGGGYNDANGGTWANSQGANGAALVIEVGGDVDAYNSTLQYTLGVGETAVRLEVGGSGNGSGEFAAAVGGVLACVDFAATYTDGRYEVVGVDPSGDWIDILLDWTGDQIDNSVRVGGALSRDLDGFKYGGASLAQGDTLKMTGTTEFTEEMSLDGGVYADGDEAARITVEGVDADGVRLTTAGTRPIIQPAVDIAGALIRVHTDLDYWDWYFLDFNGANGEHTADYGIYCNDVFSGYHRFFNCKLHDTDNACMYWRGNQNVMASCEMYNSGALAGVYLRAVNSRTIGCSAHDNTGWGIISDAATSSIQDCESYDNTTGGIFADDGFSHGTIRKNNCYGNTGDGFEIHTDATNILLYNNTSSSNGGYGYNLASDLTHFAFFGYNHSHGNTTAHYDIGADGTWAAAGHGNNITGDPLFTNVGDGTEDFTPKHGSPLLGAGFPQYFPAGGVMDAVTNYPHIGAMTRKEPKTRLIGGA